jgi:hypothetical protein
MPEDDTYYLAFWPQGTEELNYSTFRFSTSIRQPTKTKLSIDGASKPPASRCYVVRKGRSITANTRVTRNATGTVEFRLERKQKRNWKLIGTDDVALVGSKASLDQRFGQAGKYRLGADYLGDDTRAPSESKAHCFEVTG